MNIASVTVHKLNRGGDPVGVVFQGSLLTWCHKESFAAWEAGEVVRDIREYGAAILMPNYEIRPS